jgi:integrase/recombinase XerD
MKLTYSLYLSLRTDKPLLRGYFPVYYFLRVGGTMVKIPTGKHLLPHQWDKANRCPKKNSERGMAMAAELNKKISHFEVFMTQQSIMGRKATITLARSFFKEKRSVNFYDFFQDMMMLWEADKKYNTMKTYLTTLNALKEFNPRLQFGDLTYDFLQRWDHFLSTVRKNSPNGKFGKHKNLRSMIRQAILKNYMSEADNPYRHFKFKAAVGNRQYLTVQEIEQVRNVELSEQVTNIHHVRNMFLFSCFTGLRFNDVLSLTYGDIKPNPDRVEIMMQKTNKRLILPLIPQAKTIIDEYGKRSIKAQGQTIFPHICNTIVNRRIKDLMTVAKISKQISFHCARHSFAVSHIHARTSIYILKEMLGHANVEDTQIYAKVLQQDLYADMDKLSKLYSHAV